MHLQRDNTDIKLCLRNLRAVLDPMFEGITRAVPKILCRLGKGIYELVEYPFLEVQSGALSAALAHIVARFIVSHLPKEHKDPCAHKPPIMHHLTAFSKSASLNTTLGPFPPNSSMTGFKLDLALAT